MCENSVQVWQRAAECWVWHDKVLWKCTLCWIYHVSHWRTSLPLLGFYPFFICPCFFFLLLFAVCSDPVYPKGSVNFNLIIIIRKYLMTILLLHQCASYIYLSDISCVLQCRLDLVFPPSFLLQISWWSEKLTLIRSVRQVMEWYKTSYLDMVSLWQWKPISSAFAQHSFSFWGQNHIMESRCVTAGHFAGPRKWARCMYIIGFPSGETVKAVCSNVSVYQRAWWVTHVLRDMYGRPNQTPHPKTHMADVSSHGVSTSV